MKLTRRGLTAVVVAMTLTACAEGSPGHSGAPPAVRPPTRPADGLLTDPDLQAVVDLQVLRDGPGLGALLTDLRPAVRARAAFALGSVQDPGQVPALLPLLSDPVAHVRRDAAFALGQRADEAAAPALLEALGAEDRVEVRRQLLTALGRLGGREALRRVVRVDLGPGEEPWRAMAIARFGQRGVFDPEAVAWIGEALFAQDAETRTAAAYFFSRIPSGRPWMAVSGEVRRALDEYGSDEKAAMYLVLGLSALRDPADSGRLLRWLRGGSDWRTRTNAGRALSGRMQLPGVRRGLLDALDDPSMHVALAAATSLTSGRGLTDAELARVREWVSTHPERWLVGSVLLIPVAAAGDAAFARNWLAGQGNERQEARARGFMALGANPGQDVTLDLMSAVVEEPSRVAAAALRSLSQRWSSFRSDSSHHRDYFRTFAAAARSGDVALTTTAAPLLTDSVFRPLGGMEVLEEVYRGLAPPEDVESMTAVLGALGQSGDARAEPLLRRAVRHPHPVVREAAASALEDLRGLSVELPPRDDVPDRTVDWVRLSELGDSPTLILETEKGTVRLRLRPGEAPLTVQTVAGFAQAGRYDGVSFHRVVPNFVIQTGDFARGDGFGGPGFDIRSEFTLIPYHRGVAGMASVGKDTEGSQFFVTHSMQAHLDGGYTAFGWVEEGMEVVDRILEGDVVLRAQVESSAGGGG